MKIHNINYSAGQIIFIMENHVKKIWGILLIYVEICVLLVSSPIVFLKSYWLIGPKLVDKIYQNLSSHFSNLMIGVIFVVSVLSVVFIFKLRFIKNIHLKIFMVWIILMLSALVIWCLLLPFARWA